MKHITDRIFLSFLISAFILFFIAGVCPAADDKVKTRIITSDYPPFNFECQKKPAGMAVEIIEEILRRMNVKANIEIMEWERGYSITLSDPGTVLFTTVLTPERSGKFKWAGPIAQSENRLYARKGSDLKIKTLEDAKKVGKIAVVRDDVREKILRKNGFSNLVGFQGWEGAMQSLLGGKVDLVACGNWATPIIMNRIGRSMDDLKSVLSFTNNALYIAFNKGTPDDTVKKWQQHLDAMKKDGTFASIYKKWLTGEVPK